MHQVFMVAITDEKFGSVHGERANFAVLVLFCIDASDCESRRIFQSIFRDLQDVHSFAPLESQVENYLEKNLPENPKENERTRPHGKSEKVETKGDAWNSAETMRRTTAERRAAAENIFRASRG